MKRFWMGMIIAAYKFDKHLLFLLLVLWVFASGCQAGTPLEKNDSREEAFVIKKENKQTDGKIESWRTPEKLKEESEVAEVVNVLNGGLGYSFDLLYQDLNLKEWEVPGKIEEYGIVRKVQKEDFFPMITLKFTPSTGRLYTITGIKLYVGKQRFSSRSPCMEDLSALEKALKNKYPSLEKYRPFKGDEKIMVIGLAPKVKTSSLGAHVSQYPDGGKYVKITCMKSRTAIFALIIDYINGDIDKLYESERELFLKENQREILEQKGVDPDKL